jgi:hypothetical protein
LPISTSLFYLFSLELTRRRRRRKRKSKLRPIMSSAAEIEWNQENLNEDVGGVVVRFKTPTVSWEELKDCDCDPSNCPFLDREQLAVNQRHSGVSSAYCHAPISLKSFRHVTPWCGKLKYKQLVSDELNNQKENCLIK